MTNNTSDRINALENKLDYYFKDKELLLTALTHRSYNNPTVQVGDSIDNQRLEFLGDTVLGLGVSNILFNKFINFKEGQLSKIRAALVCEVTLSEVATKINLGDKLFLGSGEENGGGRSKPSILADALEAILGAVFLDSDFESAEKIIYKLWQPYFESPRLQNSWTDYKTKLQEITQEQSGEAPRYVLVYTEGPDHAKTFTMKAVLGDIELAIGKGSSKKEAEQKAAQKYLNSLNEIGEK